MLEVWARTQQRNICAEIPVSRFITAWWKCIAWQSVQSDGGKVPTRQRTANKLRQNETNQEKRMLFLSRLQEGLQRSNTGVFRRVLCEVYNLLPMPLQRHTEPQRAVITHSESRVIMPLYSYFKNQQKTAKMIDRYSGIWYNGSLNNTFFLLLVSRKRFKGCGEISPPSRF